MKRYLLINSFLGSERYFDNVSDFESALFASICGMSKIVRVLIDDRRAYSVYEICDVSKVYSGVSSMENDQKVVCSVKY